MIVDKDRVLLSKLLDVMTEAHSTQGPLAVLAMATYVELLRFRNPDFNVHRYQKKARRLAAAIHANRGLPAE